MFGRFFEGIETHRNFGEVPKFSNVSGNVPDDSMFDDLSDNIPKFDEEDSKETLYDIPKEGEPVKREYWDDIPMF